MSRKNRFRRASVARAAAPVLSVIAASALVALPPSARATTWIDGTGDWNDATKWSGTPNPPNAPVATPNTGPNVYIGNNGTVTFNGGDTGIQSFRLGFAFTGSGVTTNPGTGTLTLNSNVMNTDQDSVIGDGATGTLNIAGGTFYTKDTKHLIVGSTADGTVNLSSGNLYLSRYGLEGGGGVGTLNMSGGNLEYKQFSGTNTDNVDQILVDNFNFSGGTLGGVAGTGTGIGVATITSVSGSGLITFRKNTATTITFDIAGNNTWAGSMSAGATGAATSAYGTLTKTGVGSLTLTGLQNIKRDVQVAGGTLVFDLSVNSTGILDDDAGISLRGGTLQVVGNGGTASETFGTARKFSADVGGTTVILSPNGGTVTLNTTGTAGTQSINRVVGATVDVQAQGVGATLGTNALLRLTSTGTSGVLKGLTVNGGTEWATNSGGFVAAFGNYSAVADMGTAPSDGTKSYKPTGAQTDVTSAILVNTINLTGTVGVNMSGAGAISAASGIIGNTTGSITGGTLTATVPATAAITDLVVSTPADLTIGSNIIDNGSGFAVGLTKTGSGVLTVSGANTYTGSTFVNGGTLKIGAAGSLPTNSVIVMSNTPGATLDLNGFNATVNGLTGGGTSGGEVKLGGATLDLNNTAAGTYAGIISGAGNVNKNGSTDVTLAGDSTYTGATTINAGILYVTKLADAGQASSIGAASTSAANLVINGATLRSLQKVGTSTNRLFSVGLNGATLSGAGNPVTNTGFYAPLRFTSTGTLGMTGGAGARTLTLDAGLTAAAGTTERALNLSENLLAAVIPDSGVGAPTSVSKTGTGVWYLSGASTYTGATTISAGVLRVNTLANGGSASSIGASTNAAPNLAFADGGTLQYVGAGSSTDRAMTLAGANTIDSSGTGAVSFTSTASVSNTTLTFTGTNTGNNTFSPAITGSTALTKAGAGKWIIAGPASYSGATNVNGGGTLRLQTSQTTTSSVTVGGGSTLQLASNGTFNRVIKTATVAVTGGSKLDIDNNKLALTAQPVGTWNGTAYSDVTGLIASGYSINQDFSGSGIVTTQTTATGGNTLHNIGVASNTDLGLSTFGGVSVGANDTLAMFTYGGDANLDGAITGDDYFQIDSGFPAGAHGWFNGDFNYDGSITGDDYFVIDSNFSAQGAPIPTSAGVGGGLAGVQAVPEPASIGLIGLAAASLLGRRRRRN